MDDPLEIDARPTYLRLVSEETGRYDAEQRRPTAAEAAGGERHARIPFTVLSAELSPQAIVAYAWLQNHIGDDGCFPSFETLATEMHCSVRSAKARVAELEASHFLAHRQRGLGRSNVYELHPEGDAQTPKPRRRNPEVQKTARQAREVQKTARPDVQSSVNRSAENCTLTIPSNQTQLTKGSAPTERAAPPRTAAAKVAVTTPKQPAPTVEAEPAGATNVPPSKRAVANAPKVPNALGAVIDGIRAAGLPLVLEAGKDGKALAGLLAGSDAATDDVIACYVAIARGEYGDDYARRNLSISYVCGARCMTGYLNWKRHPTLPVRGGPNGRPRVSTADDFAALALRLEAEGR